MGSNNFLHLQHCSQWAVLLQMNKDVKLNIQESSWAAGWITGLTFVQQTKAFTTASGFKCLYRTLSILPKFAFLQLQRSRHDKAGLLLQFRLGGFCNRQFSYSHWVFGFTWNNYSFVIAFQHLQPEQKALTAQEISNTWGKKTRLWCWSVQVTRKQNISYSFF